MAGFVVSHRLAGKRTKNARLESIEVLHKAHQKLRTIASTAGGEKRPAGLRSVWFLEGDARDIESKRRELPVDVIIEPKASRTTARFLPALRAGHTHNPAASGEAGLGANLGLTLRSEGTALAGARVNLVLTSSRKGVSITLSAVTDANGNATFVYSPRSWYPAAATILPQKSVWPWYVAYPQNDILLNLPVLPAKGPLGWWHHVLGATQPGEKRGHGIRIGIIDTGAGPHPHLKHVHGVGAIVDGSIDQSPVAARDVSDHGTHVSGILGARPASDSDGYEGIAAGAGLFVVRVCAKPGTEGVEASANNGDIAVAMDALTQIHQVDLINISLAGQEPSEIEADAIQAAIEAGVLVICSAGNESGSPVMYPAAAPGAVAVSAVGLTHAFPAASLDQLTVPQDTNRFAPGGLYAANFNSIGTQIACSGPGVAIISTVPGSTATEPAYAAMSGTSMASPAVCGALATLLSEDSQYQKMPRDQARAYYAWAVLSRSLRWLGLDPQVAGLGLARAAN